MTFRVLTHTDSAFAPVSDITVPVMEEYCARHGYKFYCARERKTDRNVVWEKVPLLLAAMREPEDWLVYFDADVLLTNHTVRLETFIDPSVNIIASEDREGFNAGVLFVKNCPWSEMFFELVWKVDAQHKIYGGAYTFEATQSEQRAMIAALDDHPALRSKVKVVPQRMFNSYLYICYGDGRTEGNFIEGQSFALHLPGMRISERVEILNEYKQKIVR